jgi:hypothetical protein
LANSVLPSDDFAEALRLIRHAIQNGGEKMPSIVRSRKPQQFRIAAISNSLPNKLPQLPHFNRFGNVIL